MFIFIQNALQLFYGTQILSLNQGPIKEGYNIGVAGKYIIITGGDPVGLMYGGLQIAGQIKAGNPRSDTGRPYVKKRGIKFNVPLDARTPSYDDTGDAAQKNIEVIWEWDYWTNFLDNMARNRYNLLTLWSMHPYPSWVKVPEYPDVALDDVYAFAKPIPAGIYRDWPGVDLQAAVVEDAQTEQLQAETQMEVDEHVDVHPDHGVLGVDVRSARRHLDVQRAVVGADTELQDAAQILQQVRDGLRRDLRKE